MQRTMGWLLAVGLLPLCALGCKPSSTEGADGSAVRIDNAEQSNPVAAGADVVGLLDGLRVGAQVGDFTVTWIGAVQSNGVIPIHLERGGTRMQLVVALDAEVPRPPASTERYAVYYEKVQHGHEASAEDCAKVAALLARRIGRVEMRVPTPTGMSALAPASQPM